MADAQADFTLTFRALDPESDDTVAAGLFADPAAYDAWAARWRAAPGARAAGRGDAARGDAGGQSRLHSAQPSRRGRAGRRDRARRLRPVRGIAGGAGPAVRGARRVRRLCRAAARPTSASIAPSAAPEALPTGGGIRPHRRGRPKRSHVGWSAKARTWIPCRAMSSTSSCASGWLASLNNGVPPRTRESGRDQQCVELAGASRVEASCSSRAAMHRRSTRPADRERRARHRPRPSSSRRRAASGGGAMAKPSRTPARP